MRIAFKRRREKLVGIDVGSSFVKMIESSGPPDAPSVSGIGLKDISQVPKDAIAGAIRSLAMESGITATRAAMSVSGPSVVVRFLSMPRMKPDELKSAIKFEAEKLIPFGINDCVLDFQVLDKDDKTGKLSVLLSAVKKDYLQGRIDMLTGAGFAVEVADVDCFAIVNAFLKGRGNTGNDKALALVNIGAGRTNLAILSGPVISFARDISSGGAVTADLLDELKMSFSYHENQSGKAVDRIFISGGYSESPGIDDLFTEGVGIKPERWDPTEFLGAIPADAKKSGRCYAVAAGLILR